MMKFIFLPFLLFIGLCLLPCRPLLAGDVCGDGAGYPDQYPYKNCGGVSTLSWDQANSCEELEDNASCAVAVTGGQGPYTWTISGTGFSFASGQSSVQTTENTVTVFTQDACGAGSITITDACGSVVESAVRSTDGHWKFFGKFRPVNQVGISIPDLFNCVTNIYSWETSIPVVQYKGKYLLTDNYLDPTNGKKYRARMHPWCSCLDVGRHDYLDPVLGIFTIPGTLGHNHNIGTHQECSPEVTYRVGYYDVSGNNRYLDIFEWVCW